MPIFEYECGNCSKTFETITVKGITQKIECPHCGSGDIEKKVSSFSTKSGKSGSNCGPSKGFT